MPRPPPLLAINIRGKNHESWPDINHDVIAGSAGDTEAKHFAWTHDVKTIRQCDVITWNLRWYDGILRLCDCLGRRQNRNMLEYVSWSTSELRVRLAPWNRFKPSSIIFYCPLLGGTSFVDLLWVFSALCLLCLCTRQFICALWSPAGKGLTSWLSFVVYSCGFVTFHLYPESGVVLDCIGTWS